MEAKNLLFTGVVALLVAALSTTFTQRFMVQTEITANQDQSALLIRIEELELLLDDEVEARLDLQEAFESEIAFGLTGQNINRVGEEFAISQDGAEALFNQPQGGNNPVVGDNSEAPVSSDLQQVRAQRQDQRAERLRPDYKQQQLVKSGFADSEASWIVQRESEIQLSRLFDNYNQRRSESQQSLTDNDAGMVQELSANQQLRSEIGDDYYERYLEVQGLPTSVTVGSVMSSSPGESAGLLPGDTIVSYDGSRVFSLQDVNNLTIRGNAGESVLIEVQRAGASVQLAIPRGPIGVTQARGRFGR
jgi:C-terminal processing protease CtpA/Prc